MSQSVAVRRQEQSMLLPFANKIFKLEDKSFVDNQPTQLQRYQSQRGNTAQNSNSPAAKDSKQRDFRNSMRKMLILKACDDKPELLNNIKQRFINDKKVKENQEVQLRLKQKLNSMQSTRRLPHILCVPAVNTLPRMDSESCLDFGVKRHDSAGNQQIRDLFYDQFQNIQLNKQQVGARKIRNFAEQMTEIPPMIDLNPNGIEVIGHSLFGLKSKQQNSKEFEQEQEQDQQQEQQYENKNKNSPSVDQISVQIQNLCDVRASVPMLQYKIPNILNSESLTVEQKKQNDKNNRQICIKQLKVSTGEKERLGKRREKIKSMRFLRQTGKRLREDLAKQIKAHGKFQRHGESHFLGGLGGNTKIQHQLKSSQALIFNPIPDGTFNNNLKMELNLPAPDFTVEQIKLGQSSGINQSLYIQKNDSRAEQESTITDYLCVNGEYSEAQTNGKRPGSNSFKSSQRAYISQSQIKIDSAHPSQKTSLRNSAVKINPIKDNQQVDYSKEEIPFLMQKIDSKMEEVEYFEEDSSLQSSVSLQIQSVANNSLDKKQSSGERKHQSQVTSSVKINHKMIESNGPEKTAVESSAETFNRQNSFEFKNRQTPNIGDQISPSPSSPPQPGASNAFTAKVGRRRSECSNDPVSPSTNQEQQVFEFTSEHDRFLQQRNMQIFYLQQNTLSNVSEEQTNDQLDDSSYADRNNDVRQIPTMSIFHGQSINSNGTFSPKDIGQEGDLSGGYNNKTFLKQQNYTMTNVAIQGISNGTSSDFEIDPKLRKQEKGINKQSPIKNDDCSSATELMENDESGSRKGESGDFSRQSEGETSEGKMMPQFRLFNISTNDIKNPMLASVENKFSRTIGVSNIDQSNDDSSSVLEDSFDSEVQRKYGGEEETSKQDSSDLEDSYDSEVQQHFTESGQKKDQKKSKEVKTKQPKNKKNGNEIKELVPVQSENPKIKNLFISLQHQNSISNSSQELVSESGSVSDSSIASLDVSCDDPTQKMQQIQMRQKKLKQLEENVNNIDMNDLNTEPLLNRGDIVGEDDELSDIEEFYLTEIEQIQNADLMFNLQREERRIRDDIAQCEDNIQKNTNAKQRPLIPKGSDWQLLTNNNVRTLRQADRNFHLLQEQDRLKCLYRKLQNHEKKKNHFAFNVYKNNIHRVSDCELFQENEQDDQEGMGNKKRENKKKKKESNKIFDDKVIADLNRDNSDYDNSSVSSQSLSSQNDDLRIIAKNHQYQRQTEDDRNYGSDIDLTQKKLSSRSNYVGFFDQVQQKSPKNTVKKGLTQEVKKLSQQVKSQTSGKQTAIQVIGKTDERLQTDQKTQLQYNIPIKDEQSSFDEVCVDDDSEQSMASLNIESNMSPSQDSNDPSAVYIIQRENLLKVQQLESPDSVLVSNGEGGQIISPNDSSIIENHNSIPGSNDQENNRRGEEVGQNQKKKSTGRGRRGHQILSQGKRAPIQSQSSNIIPNNQQSTFVPSPPQQMQVVEPQAVVEESKTQSLTTASRLQNQLNNNNIQERAKITSNQNFGQSMNEVRQLQNYDFSAPNPSKMNSMQDSQLQQIIEESISKQQNVVFNTKVEHKKKNQASNRMQQLANQLQQIQDNNTIQSTQTYNFLEQSNQQSLPQDQSTVQCSNVVGSKQASSVETDLRGTSTYKIFSPKNDSQIDPAKIFKQVKNNIESLFTDLDENDLFQPKNTQILRQKNNNTVNYSQPSGCSVGKFRSPIINSATTPVFSKSNSNGSYALQTKKSQKTQIEILSTNSNVSASLVDLIDEAFINANLKIVKSPTDVQTKQKFNQNTKSRTLYQSNKDSNLYGSSPVQDKMYNRMTFGQRSQVSSPSRQPNTNYSAYQQSQQSQVFKQAGGHNRAQSYYNPTQMLAQQISEISPAAQYYQSQNLNINESLQKRSRNQFAANKYQTQNTNEIRNNSALMVHPQKNSLQNREEIPLEAVARQFMSYNKQFSPQRQRLNPYSANCSLVNDFVIQNHPGTTKHQGGKSLSHHTAGKKSSVVSQIHKNFMKYVESKEQLETYDEILKTESREDQFVNKKKLYIESDEDISVMSNDINKINLQIDSNGYIPNTGQNKNTRQSYGADAMGSVYSKQQYQGSINQSVISSNKCVYHKINRSEIPKNFQTQPINYHQFPMSTKFSEQKKFQAFQSPPNQMQMTQKGPRNQTRLISPQNGRYIRVTSPKAYNGLQYNQHNSRGQGSYY